jgi:hypothetical protein
MRAVVLFLALTACATPSRLVVGERVALDADELHDRGGRPLLVDVWASWCERCSVVIRRHAGLTARSASPITHVGWNVDASASHATQASSGLPGNVVLVRDPAARRLSRNVSIDRLPVTLLLAPDGRILFAGESFSDDAALQRALSSDPR